MVENFDNFRSKHVKSSDIKNNVYIGYKGERLGYKDRKKSKPIPEAYKYGKYNGHPADQKMIAIIAYGDRKELGNKGGEDGWTFKGRGLLQITGRGNYKIINEVINKRAPGSGVNVLAPVPATGYTPHQAALTGMAEWIAKGLYSIASGSTKENDDEIVNKIVDKLNSKTNSRSKRIEHYRGSSTSENKNSNLKYKPTKEIFRVNDCILLTGKEKEKKTEKGKRAPWMEIAWREEFQKLVETGNNKKIWKFFKRTAYEKLMGTKDKKGKLINERTISWCAAFVNWCFENSTRSFRTPHSAGSASFINHKKS